MISTSAPVCSSRDRVSSNGRETEATDHTSEVVVRVNMCCNSCERALKNMVDRTSRDRMMQTIRSYMDEEIASDQFDDVLQEIALTSPDETVREILRELWFFYDE